MPPLLLRFLIHSICFIVSALAIHAQEKVQNSTDDSIMLHVTVTDADGRFVTGLQKEAFTIYDNKAPQELIYFNKQDVPVSVGILFDISYSMSESDNKRFAAFAKAKLLEFVNQSNSSNEYFIIGFDEHPHLLTDWTSDKNVVAEALSKLISQESFPRTALYDACYLSIEKVARGRHSKRAIILITDAGNDNASRYKKSDINRLLKEKDVLMYSIRFNFTGINFPIDEKSPILSEWASLTGGKAYSIRSLGSPGRIYTQAERDRSVLAAALVEINNFIGDIALELRSQYTIGFRPTSSTGKDKWHQIKIKVTPPRGLTGIEGRSRKGYFGK